MNILILNASPKKNGNISKMVKLFVGNLSEKHKVEEIFTQNFNIKPCISCMACRHLDKCILVEDDAHIVLNKIYNSDLIIIASPTYWGSMPGTLKILFDRIVYGLMGESKRGIPIPKLKDKKGIIITTCTTPFPFNIIFKQSTGLINSIKEIFKYSGIKLSKTIVFSGTKDKKEIPKKIIKKIEELANSM